MALTIGALSSRAVIASKSTNSRAQNSRLVIRARNDADTGFKISPILMAGAVALSMTFNPMPQLVRADEEKGAMTPNERKKDFLRKSREAALLKSTAVPDPEVTVTAADAKVDRGNAVEEKAVMTPNERRKDILRKAREAALLKSTAVPAPEVTIRSADAFVDKGNADRRAALEAMKEEMKKQKY
jgi:hypothetical protein